MGKNGKHSPIPPEVERLSRPLLDAAYKVHTELGPGMLESVYEGCLTHELKKQRIEARQQVELPVVYDGLVFDHGFRIDLLVENKIVVELKCVDEILPVHEAQLLTYLRLSKLRLGFLLNFKVPSFKRGIKRMAL